MTVWPAAVTVVGDADFTIDSDGAATEGAVEDDGGEVVELPDGVVPVAVAVLVILPAFTSAWVTV